MSSGCTGRSQQKRGRSAPRFRQHHKAIFGLCALVVSCWWVLLFDSHVRSAVGVIFPLSTVIGSAGEAKIGVLVRVPVCWYGALEPPENSLYCGRSAFETDLGEAKENVSRNSDAMESWTTTDVVILVGYYSSSGSTQHAVAQNVTYGTARRGTIETGLRGV